MDGMSPNRFSSAYMDIGRGEGSGLLGSCTNLKLFATGEGRKLHTCLFLSKPGVICHNIKFLPCVGFLGCFDGSGRGVPSLIVKILGSEVAKALSTLL